MEHKNVDLRWWQVVKNALSVRVVCLVSKNLVEAGSRGVRALMKHAEIDTTWVDGQAECNNPALTEAAFGYKVIVSGTCNSASAIGLFRMTSQQPLFQYTGASSGRMYYDIARRPEEFEPVYAVQVSRGYNDQFSAVVYSMDFPLINKRVHISTEALFSINVTVHGEVTEKDVVGRIEKTLGNFNPELAKKAATAIYHLMLVINGNEELIKFERHFPATQIPSQVPAVGSDQTVDTKTLADVAIANAGGNGKHGKKEIEVTA